MAATTLRPYEEALREGAQSVLGRLTADNGQAQLAESDGRADFLRALAADPVKAELTLHAHLYLLLAAKIAGHMIGISDIELRIALDHWTLEMGQLPRPS